MRQRIKSLFKLLLVVVLGVVSYQWYQGNNKTLHQLFFPDADVDVPPTDTPVESKSELDSIFMYLPFLGFQFQDVAGVDGSDLFAVQGKRFSYRGNVLEVYELDDGASATALMKQAKEQGMVERVVDGKKKKFLAMALRNFLCLVIEINDPVALKESYESAVQTFQNLGIDFE